MGKYQSCCEKAMKINSLSAGWCFSSFACRNDKCQVKFFFFVLCHHSPPSLVLVSAGAAQPSSQLPDSPHYSPNSQWISSSSPLPSLYLLPPGRQQEELGHTSAATARGKNGCVSIPSRSTSRRRQQQWRWGESGSLYQQLCAISLTRYKGAGYLHLPTWFMSPPSLWYWLDWCITLLVCNPLILNRSPTPSYFCNRDRGSWVILWNVNPIAA